MKIFDVITHSGFYEQLPSGDETDWMEFAELTIKNGKLAVSDPLFFRDLRPPPTFTMGNGRYSVAVKLTKHDNGEVYVSRLRILRGEGADFGKQLDMVGVDFAQVGVFDPLVLEDALAHMTEEHASLTMDKFSRLALCDVAQFGDESAIMPLVSSALGDGRYPIHELSRDGQRVGLEVVFIGPEI